MALTNAQKAVALNAALADATKVIWYKGSAGSEAEATEVAATALNGSVFADRFNGASSANPSVISNKGTLESAAASAGVTVTAFVFANASNTALTTVNRLDSSVVLLEGGKVSVADAALKEQLSHS